MLKKVVVFICTVLAAVFPGQQTAGPLPGSDMYQALVSALRWFALLFAIAVDSLKVFDELKLPGIDIMQGNFLDSPTAI